MQRDSWPISADYRRDRDRLSLAMGPRSLPRFGQSPHLLKPSRVANFSPPRPDVPQFGNPSSNRVSSKFFSSLLFSFVSNITEWSEMRRNAEKGAREKSLFIEKESTIETIRGILCRATIIIVIANEKLNFHRFGWNRFDFVFFLLVESEILFPRSYLR